MPAATAAAAPPEDPPAEYAKFHGLRQGPNRRGSVLGLMPRHRETQEANADASGTAHANVDALGPALMCPSRGGTYAPCTEVGTLPLTVEGGRARKLFAQVITPNHDGYRQRHHRYVHHRVR